MTQGELDCEVAEKTGESTDTIVERGVVPLTPVPVEREPDREPFTIDWDDLDA